VAHGDLAGPLTGHYPSQFDAYGLRLGLPEREREGSVEESVWSHHKIGGRPFLLDVGPQEAIQGESAPDLIHVLQLCFPDNLDLAMAGNWPFGEDNFHLFMDQASNRFWYLIGR